MTGGTLSQRLLLTVRETAAMLALSERKLWELTNREGLPSIRIGRLVRYSLTDVEDWVRRQNKAGSKVGTRS